MNIVNVIVGYRNLIPIYESRPVSTVSRGVFQVFPSYARESESPAIGCYVGDEFCFVSDDCGKIDHELTRMNVGAAIPTETE